MATKEKFQLHHLDSYVNGVVELLDPVSPSLHDKYKKRRSNLLQ